MISAGIITLGLGELAARAITALKSNDLDTLRALDVSIHGIFTKSLASRDRRRCEQLRAALTEIAYSDEGRRVERPSQVQITFLRWRHLCDLLANIRFEGDVVDQAERFIASREHSADLLRTVEGAGSKGITAGDLAEALEISPQYLSRLVAELERQDIVERYQIGRNVYVRLGLMGQTLTDRLAHSLETGAGDPVGGAFGAAAAAAKAAFGSLWATAAVGEASGQSVVDRALTHLRYQYSDGGIASDQSLMDEGTALVESMIEGCEWASNSVDRTSRYLDVLPSESGFSREAQIGIIERVLVGVAHSLEQHPKRGTIFRSIVKEMVALTPQVPSLHLDMVQAAHHNQWPGWTISHLPSLFFRLDATGSYILWELPAEFLRGAGYAFVEKDRLCGGHLLEVFASAPTASFIEQIAMIYEEQRNTIPFQKGLTAVDIEAKQEIERLFPNRKKLSEHRRREIATFMAGA